MTIKVCKEKTTNALDIIGRGILWVIWLGFVALIPYGIYFGLTIDTIGFGFMGFGVFAIIIAEGAFYYNGQYVQSRGPILQINKAFGLFEWNEDC